MPRTNISIADEVADSLSEQAMKRNKTLYAFANESLGAVISVCRLSGEPSEVLHAVRSNADQDAKGGKGGRRIDAEELECDAQIARIPVSR